ncbi:MAG: DNA polymerase IV [Pigmentiphaga sp.]
MITRVIAHLDMDAFFASVELLRYPELRGRPVVVGGRGTLAPERRPDGTHHFARLRQYVGRGVITTATYEARAFGVHSAMGLMKAAALAPDAVILPADFEAYRHQSRRFKETVAGIAPQIEDRGIDEIYIDLPDHPWVRAGGPAQALARGGELARDLQDAVRAATGLSCSLGITPNKLLSKLASDLDKPGGVTILHYADVATRIWPLPASRINGIGPKAAARLASLGIHSVGDLAAAEPDWLVAQFGARYGHWLHASAHGRDDRPVVTERERKSVSRETTFSRDLHPVLDREELGSRFTQLCERVADDLRRLQYEGRTVGIKLRYDDFRTVTRDLTLEAGTADARAIRRAAGQCLKRVPLDRRLRLLGVRVGGLGRPGETAVPLASITSTSLPLFPESAGTDAAAQASEGPRSGVQGVPASAP